MGMGIALVPPKILTWNCSKKAKKAEKEGFIKKELALKQICRKYKITLKNIAFIGDDVNDLEVLRKVGLSAVPNDSILQAKQLADYTCKASGGKGCFREFIDAILLAKFPSKTKWYLI